MANQTPPPQPIRVYARITPELYKLLQQVRVAQQFTSDADVVRRALQAYLDEQSDQVASKRHFSASFRRRMDHVDWHLSVITYLLAQTFALLITRATGQKVLADTLLEQAIRQASQHHGTLHERLDFSRSQSERKRS